MTGLNEADVEAAAVGWLAEQGWSVAHGSEVNPDAAPAERADYSAVVLASTLREALGRLNPELPGEALGNAVRRLTHPEGATLEARNRAFHRMVVDGVTVEYRDGGRVRDAQARVIDFDDPANNDWQAVNQFTVVENKIERRPDVVLFVNGLPLGVIELKNPTDADATIWTAWQQLQTYKADLPGLFSMNAVMDERGDDRVRRPGGPAGHPHRRTGVVQALAYHRRCCASLRFRPRPGPISGICSTPRRAAWCSPPSRSSSPTTRATGIRGCRSGATSS